MNLKLRNLGISIDFLTGLRIEITKGTYEREIEEQIPWEEDDDWFEDDKIAQAETDHLYDDRNIVREVTERIFEREIEPGLWEVSEIRFSHPSYSEALPFLFLEDGRFTPMNIKVFSNVLINLSGNKDA